MPEQWFEGGDRKGWCMGSERLNTCFSRERTQYTTPRLQAASRSNVELWPLVGYGHTEGIRLEPGYPDWSPMRKDYRSRVRSFFTAIL